MSINLVSPTTYTSGVLVTDTYIDVNSDVPDCIPSLTIENGEPNSAALEIQSTTGALVLPRMSEEERDAMNSIDASLIFNTDHGEMQFKSGGEWYNVGDGNGNVTGPDNSGDGNIALFNGDTGTLLKDSTVSIDRVVDQAPLLRKKNKNKDLNSNIANDLVNQISNLGNVQFTNDVGFVFVDGLVGAQFITNDFGPDSQVCCLINGELPSSSSTPSALLEIQSTTGALLISRMTTSQIDALTSPQNGMVVYDLTLNQFKFRQNGTWINIAYLPTNIIDDGSNLFVGTNSGNLTYSGLRNTSCGDNSLNNITSGADNTSIGNNASNNLTTGAFNVAIGSSALYFNINGTGNIAIGAGSATVPTTINECVFIGHNSDPPVNNLTNSIAIGSSSSISVSNAANIGNNCYVGINNPAPAYTLDLANVSNQCGIRLQNSTFIPTTPSSGSGVLFLSGGQPYYLDSSGTTTSLLGGSVIGGSYPPTYNTQSLITQSANQGGFCGSAQGTQVGLGVTSTQFFDTKAVNSASAGFTGSAFDGKYIYFAPQNNGSPSGQITRYDTRSSFYSSSSYSFFDTKALNSKSYGFNGAIYDGSRYVYFIPFGDATAGFQGQITRYDTEGDFLDSASYSFFDMAANVSPVLLGFSGAFFDQRRYLYFTPSITAVGVYSPYVGIYDVTKPFTSATSYSIFDMSAIPGTSGNCRGMAGGTFDGAYGYFVPNSIATGVRSGLITRVFSSNGPTNVGSYSAFDVSTVNSNAKGFRGAVFDGRYVYFIPFSSTSGSYTGLLTRYDTFGSFTSSSSYSFFDTKPLIQIVVGFGVEHLTEDIFTYALILTKPVLFQVR